VLGLAPSGTTLYRARSTASWSSTFYVKYMPYENKAKNGGLGIATGSGSYPGHFESESTTASFRSYWVLPEATLPLLGGTVLWDINPGVMVNADYGDRGKTAWGFSGTRFIDRQDNLAQ